MRRAKKYNRKRYLVLLLLIGMLCVLGAWYYASLKSSQPHNAQLVRSPERIYIMNKKGICEEWERPIRCI